MTPQGPAGASPCSQSETESTGHGEQLRTNEEDFRGRSTSAEKAAGNALGPSHEHLRRNCTANNSCFSSWCAAASPGNAKMHLSLPRLISNGTDAGRQAALPIQPHPFLRSLSRKVDCVRCQETAKRETKATAAVHQVQTVPLQAQSRLS